MKSAKWWMGLCVVGCVCAAAGASAALPRASETSGGVTWTYSIADHGAIVTAASPATGALTVPATLGGQPVVEIGYAAFASCEELTAVTIPSGVESIADRAFQYCSLLTEVAIPESVTNIGALAFQYCESLPSLALPQGLESIGTNACYHCTGMQKLYVPLAWWGTSKASAASAACTVVYGEPDKETVLFDANGGSCATASRSYAVGQPYGWLPEATHTYYAFTGWWTATNGGTLLTATNLASVEGRRVLYAQWTPRTFQVVAFDPNGGLCDTTNRTYDFGSTYSPLPLPTREHYAFAGWWTSSYGGENITEESAVTTNAARTLYAHWTLTEQVVTFNANGGTCETTNRAFEIGKTYKPLPQATREHYAFDGWWTSSYGGESITEESAVTTNADRILYAHWTPTEQVVTFNANGGTCDTPNRAFEIGKTYKPLPKATREGYAFDGWFTGSSGGDRISAATTVTASETRTLYAHWTLVEQLVTFDASGGQCDTRTHSYAVGGTYGWLPEVTRDGCAFAGWRTPDGEEVVETSVVPEQRFLTLQARWLQYYLVYNEKAQVIRMIPTNALGSFVIPAECQGYPITSIGSSAFSGCSGLTSVTIPDSVTSIGNDAFYNCYGLTSVTIPDSVTSIGDDAFYSCTNLTSVTIGNSVTSIGYRAFNGCASTLFDTNSIPGVRLVDGWAVGNSGALRGTLDLTGVRGIAENAFSDCRGLKSVTIPDSVTSIGSYAFNYCWSLASVTIPDSVTNIGSSTFSGCSGLTSVTIPDSVTSIGGSAFSGCNGLTNVTIPDSVTSIGNWAFSSCSGLTSVTIPDSVTSIGGGAFSNCWSLASVTILGNVTDDWSDWRYNYNPSPFSSCSNISTLVLGGNMTKIGSYMFSGCSGLTSVTIGDSVTSIGSYAFSNCWSLASVTIPDSVTSIGEYAFYGCSGLTNVTIPDSVTSIGDAVFYGCSGLASVTIPDSVTSIGDYAFEYCSGLTSVAIPDSVTSIGWGAFSGCSGLTSVTIPDSVTSIGYNAFYNCSGLKTLYAPESWKTKYVGGTFWSSYASVPWGCEIIYYAPPKTSTGVPYAWLDEHGLGDGTAEGYEAVAATNAANGVNKVWECYVAGLDPADPAARFTAEIGFTNGLPVVSWTPDLNEKGAKSERSYEVEGRPTMTNAWGGTNAASRFFRVKVALPRP